MTPPGKVFTEADWSHPERPIGPYHRAKTLAERAAWEFAAGPENTGPFELVAVNPGDVFGPLLDREYHASAQAIHSIMGKGALGVARVDMPVVDVRDVAAAHLEAMLVPIAAAGVSAARPACFPCRRLRSSFAAISPAAAIGSPPGCGPTSSSA